MKRANKFKLVIIFLVFASAILGGIVLLYQYNQYINRDIESTLLNGAQQIIRLYDLSRGEELIRKGKESHPEYVSLVGDLETIAQVYGFPYIYLLAPVTAKGENFFFIFDLDPESFMTHYDDAPSEVSQCFREGETVISKPYRDKWGFFRSVFVPIRNDSDLITGVLGIDLDVTHIREKKAKAWLSLVLTETLILFLFLVSSRTLFRRISAPIKEAEEEAGRNERRYRELFDNTPVSLWEEDFGKIFERFNRLKEEGITDLESHLDTNPDLLATMMRSIHITDVNQETVSLLEGDRKEQFLGSLIIPPNARQTFKEELISLWAGKTYFEREVDYETLKGNGRKVLLRLFMPQEYQEGDGNQRRRAIISLVDITRIKEMESELGRSQRMRAIGQLAGGIAHDFNNILTGIMGYAELCRTEIDEDSDQVFYYQNIVESCEKAADLVDRILNFGRSGRKGIEPIVLHHVISETVNQIRSFVPSSVNIITEIQETEQRVLATETGIHDILMNLTTNAVEAMKEKGKLTIRLKSLAITALLPTSLKSLAPGNYMLLQVDDEGGGITREQRELIFEPYYTTGGLESNGLGLSLVYGIVQSFDGGIIVESRPERGTRFSVYLPLLPE